MFLQKILKHSKQVENMKRIVFMKLRKIFCYRKLSFMVTILAWILLLMALWKVSVLIRSLLQPIPPNSSLDQDLNHFQRTRNLTHYLKNIKLLIEPSKSHCDDVEDVPVIVMVASAPSHIDYREAIRHTWGKHLPTYFIMGLDYTNDNQLSENYVEAKKYCDLVIYDFKEHYQNLTLKTSLMMEWTLARCPNAQFLYKTDDDIMVNPWIFKEVLQERGKNVLILGYIHNKSAVHRDQNHKWYLPSWLCEEDVVSQHVAGPGYLINKSYIGQILKSAEQVPLHNIEDIYFSYNVVSKNLGYQLSHDSRLYPYRPWPSWLPLSCAYWIYASIHSLTPSEILRVWSYLESMSKQYVKGKKLCQFYEKYLQEYFDPF